MRCAPLDVSSLLNSVTLMFAHFHIFTCLCGCVEYSNVRLFSLILWVLALVCWKWLVSVHYFLLLPNRATIRFTQRFHIPHMGTVISKGRGTAHIWQWVRETVTGLLISCDKLFRTGNRGSLTEMSKKCNQCDFASSRAKKHGCPFKLWQIAGHRKPGVLAVVFVGRGFIILSAVYPPCVETGGWSSS